MRVIPQPETGLISDPEEPTLQQLLGDYLDTMLQEATKVDQAAVDLPGSHLTARPLTTESSVAEPPIIAQTDETLPSNVAAVIQSPVTENSRKRSSPVKKAVSHRQQTSARARFPERDMPEFDCLRFISGGFLLLTPIARIGRVALACSMDVFYAQSIPECLGKSTYTLHLAETSKTIPVEQVIDLYTVKNDAVNWRSEEARMPWFRGIHRSLLCQIFDPYLLIADVNGQHTDCPQSLETA
ncbi:MAG: hypothetical protein KUG79_10025 [Pseudomonadales bacterium]|nr:hypothetical protein [Pseudomonadales bacterium]